MSKEFKTPVLIIGFNRPDLLNQVFDSVAAVGSKKIYVAIDGPRNDRDKKKIDEIRNYVKKFGGNIRARFNEKNLGCKYGPVAAMNWFFEQEDRGIILEDDVLADKSFFYFAQELLEKYKNDNRIGSISGNNFHFGWRNTPKSYYFSRYSHSCGWATWRRAWKKYDIEVPDWPENRKFLDKIFDKRIDKFYWKLIFDGIKNQEMTTAWDYQWNMMMWTHNMLGIIPTQNLVKNIGFNRSDATHTKTRSKFDDMKVEKMTFPLKHPAEVVRNVEADDRTQKQNYVLWKEVGMKIIRLWQKYF